jgi:hypothetical protein
MTDADRRALEGYARAARYDPRAEITVRWPDDDAAARPQRVARR